MDGFLLINKPCGPSSFQIVSRIRRALHVKKVGHAGTLDPMASGLLVVALGNATRLIQYIPSEPKVYQFGIQFGKQTDTLDSEGVVLCQSDIIPGESELRVVLQKFLGEQEQQPPAFSALKINGVRAYDLARKGKDVQLEPRKINIYSIQLLEYDLQTAQAKLEVQCSGGTYVRVLARDIAAELGTCGYASFINRLGVGNFNVSSAVNLESCTNLEKYVISVKEVFDKLPSVEVTTNQNDLINDGRDIELSENFQSALNMVFAYKNQKLLAILKHKEGSVYHPAHVFRIDE
ncbi:MAG: tRNA pseudouridine(55) synthase TruB [Fibrobacter sp.]|nr:tRNA pseudouridine(55) synthase TruB [Fibrobacter sp.]